jgi:hypothetical protein
MRHGSNLLRHELKCGVLRMEQLIVWYGRAFGSMHLSTKTFHHLTHHLHFVM